MVFDNFESDKHNRDALKAAIMFVDEFMNSECDHGLLFYGPTGTGKTHLACAIVNRVIDLGVFARFVRAVDVPRHDSDLVLELADPAMNPLLVLDDIGTAKLTERFVEVQYMLIDGRLWECAPLVVTANGDLDAIERFVNAAHPTAGSRLVSRLSEACELVPLFGPDRRRNKK
jgi:DNA replication protein DnaC